jgi:hypothetical protein
MGVEETTTVFVVGGVDLAAVVDALRSQALGW